MEFLKWRIKKTIKRLDSDQRILYIGELLLKEAMKREDYKQWTGAIKSVEVRYYVNTKRLNVSTAGFEISKNEED